MRGQKLGIRIALLVAVVVLISYTVTILIISYNIKSSSEEAAYSESNDRIQAWARSECSGIEQRIEEATAGCF